MTGGCVIVTGARAGADELAVWEALDAFHAERRIALLMHGDCPDPHADEPRQRDEVRWSVDQCASRWRKLHRREGMIEHAWPAPVEIHGAQAGPMRNGWMARSLARYRAAGRGVAVLAFPGGAGTADMVRQAEGLTLPVWTWCPESGRWRPPERQPLEGVI